MAHKKSVKISASGSTGIEDRIISWLRLLRLPNILTAPGDVLAGYFLAGIGTAPQKYRTIDLLLCIAASVLIYCAGLLQNDYCDREKDARKRPERPIPSGQINSSSAITAAIVLFSLGLFASGFVGLFPLVICSSLLCLVISYNCLTKNLGVSGVVNMGLCRGLNLLLGASVLGRTGIFCRLTLTSAFFLTVYISFLTMVSAEEEKPKAMGLKRWIFPAILLFWFLVLFLLIGGTDSHSVFIITGGFTILWTMCLAVGIGNHPGVKEKQHFVGSLIRTLLLVQATLISVSGMGSKVVYIILILTWPVSCILSKWFYSS